jgi:hypothetical protein
MWRGLCVVCCCFVLISCGEEAAEVSAPPGPTPLPAFEELPVQEAPPALLEMLDGRAVESAAQWASERRPEVIRILEHYAYGEAPASEGIAAEVVAEYDDFLNGLGVLRLVRLRYGPDLAGEAEVLVALPKARSGPVPVFLGLNFFGNQATTTDPRVPLTARWVPGRIVGVEGNRALEASRGAVAERWPYEEVLRRGFGLVTVYHGDFDPDRDEDSDGVQALYRAPGAARGPHEWGTVAAWAWGLSRVVDYLVTDPDVDGARIAVVGHSRNGKAALLASALDERIALVISNMSGCMGAAIHRRRQGETIAAINLFFPHWFALELRRFDELEERLPFDQHFLIALSAPRPVLIASGADDGWADPEGEFEGARGASVVYALLGSEGLGAERWPEVNALVETRLGYHVRPGGHGIGPEDWAVFLRFAERHLR